MREGNTRVLATPASNTKRADTRFDVLFVRGADDLTAIEMPENACLKWSFLADDTAFVPR